MLRLGAPNAGLLNREEFAVDDEPDSRFHRWSRVRKSTTSVVTNDPLKVSCCENFPSSIRESDVIDGIVLLPTVTP